jgi:regulator of replication initiation timing
MKLTAEQSARLDDLTARADALNAAELAELAFLRGLQADASEESDESDTADTADTSDESEETTDEPDTSETPSAAAPASKKPGIFERAASVLQSRSALLADLSGVRDQLAAMTAERDTLAAQVADLRSRAEAGEAFAARVAELESERHTVSQAAARIAASSHVTEADLPETSSDEIETLDSVREKLATEKDPKERSRLAKKARALRNATASPVGLN